MHSTIFFVLFSIFIFFLYLHSRKPKKFPKGPFCFPFLGTVPQLLWHRYITKTSRQNLFMQYFKKYGKLFSLQFGSFQAVFINDGKLIKDAWNNPSLCGRPKIPGHAARTGGVIRGIKRACDLKPIYPTGVLFQDGEEWMEQRRFALRHLKDFGFGKKSMESLVMEEVLELIDGFKVNLGKPISTQNRFNIAVLNSLWMIVAGQRFSHDDKELMKILDSFNKAVQVRGIVFYIPWLKDVFPKLSGWEKFIKELPGSYNFLTKFIQERIRSYKEGEEPEHFTDVYINEMRKTTNPDSSFYKDRGEKTLIATLLDLFAAGAETTSTTLTYTFLYLAVFPDKQKKLHDEIDRCLGSRYPTLEDRSRMPYTEAVIMETLRYSSMVPFGLFHKALADTVFHGYFIPKDTWVVANLYAVHHDRETWGDPEEFRPERFISPDSEEIIRHESLIPFSYGKRVCLGETLAKDELFLFITSIFQQFVVSTDPSSPKPKTNQQQETLIISAPKPHKLVLNVRN